jgi:deazaflavin-dependent oxidoreductase (nitroreductase family)
MQGGRIVMPLATLKRRIARTFSGYLVNPIVKLVAGRVPGVPALLETIGRKSGEPRHTPVGNGLSGHTFWLVAEHGRHSDYVQNMIANPRVRVRVGGTWLRGTAHLMRKDDPRARLRKLDPLNSAVVRLVGTDLLTIRIDLEP